MNLKKNMMGLILSIIVIGGIIVGMRAWIGNPRNPITAPKVTAMIEKEVPIGSNKMQVDAFLNSKDIGHSYFDSRNEDFHGWSDVVLSGILVEQVGGITTATIPDTSRSLMITGDIRIVFLFDKHGKLLKYTVNEILTGP